MVFRRSIIFISFIFLFTISNKSGVLTQSISIDTKGTSNEENPFVPTKEWQTVKEGQKVPPGLHVRFNMQTGLVEAKLLDKDAEKDKDSIPMLVRKGEKVTAGVTKKGVTVTPQEDSKHVSSKTSTHLTREQIMEALKNVKNNDDVKDQKIADEAKKQKFRSYEELKKDFDKMNVHVKMDIEVIKELMAKVNSTNSTVEEKKSSLTDLEYYLHQIDNAIDFMNLDGLKMLLDLMNDSEQKVRSEAIFAMGSAIQSNVKVQIRALEIGLLENLKLKLLLEKETVVLNRVLYSLSTLLRNFPFAQMKFVRTGVMDAIKSLFIDTERSQPRLKIRIATLLYDLVNERITQEMKLNKSNDMQVERLRQYKQVNIVFHIIKNGWCELIKELLSLPGHDSREKVLISLIAFHDFCPASSPDKERELLEHLKPLVEEYTKLSEEEVKEGDKNGFFNSLLHRVVELQHKVMRTPERDEL